MSTETHDELIEKAVYLAKSLGYSVADKNLGTDTGADALFQNRFGEKVILERPFVLLVQKRYHELEESFSPIRKSNALSIVSLFKSLCKTWLSFL